MPETSIFISFAILLGAALIGGMVAHRLKQPVILGYLVIGAFLGPYGFGVIKDTPMVESTATIGVTLLMFTLGLEVSIGQLRQVGRVGLWGGLAQIALTAVLGGAAGKFVLGWSLPESVIFGLVISLSSTMVCLKILMDRGELDTVHGRIMIAMLILQDIAAVAMIVVTPVLGGAADNLLLSLALSAGKAVLFVGLIIALGLWVLPWLMGRVAGVRSRELFLLIVLTLCLGAAIGTQILGLSTVFGAFLIGLVLRETKFAHEALAEVTPLRDVFAALFFVSLGMLLDYKFVLDNWVIVLATVGLIIAIKTLVVFGITRFFGYGNGIALLAAAGLFQIGEFGFILAQGGVSAGVVSGTVYSLIISCAIITMLLTPVSISLASRLYGQTQLALKGKGPKGMDVIPKGKPEKTSQVIIAGFGRVGQNVALGLRNAGLGYSVIEIDPEVVSRLQCGGTSCIYGDASNAHVLARAELQNASTLVVTFPDPLAVVTTVKAALMINPKLRVVARAHRKSDIERLKKLGVKHLISPEFEASLEFIHRVLALNDWSDADIDRVLRQSRREGRIGESGEDEST